MALPSMGEVDLDLPRIVSSHTFPDIIAKLSTYIQDAITSPAVFDDFRSQTRFKLLTKLIHHLADEVQHKHVVAALLALRSYYPNMQTDDEPGVNLARGYACEFVAWRYVLQLSEWEAIDCLLEELNLVDDPTTTPNLRGDDEEQHLLSTPHEQDRRRSPEPTQYIPGHRQTGSQSLKNRPRPISLRFDSVSDLFNSTQEEADTATHARNKEFAIYFDRLNALEIATVAGAKKFLSQRVVQKLIEKIWRGDIVFWESMSVDSIKEAKVYNKRKADPFCRLRVPRYLKFFEAVFFMSFLALYYAVLVPIQRSGRRPPSAPSGPAPGQTPGISDDRSRAFHSITPVEILLYIWIAGFAYDEFGEYRDAGQAFYSTDFWSLWDLGTVIIGLAFFILRILGLAKQSDEIIGTSFDVLSLAALFLVPRIFSILSLNSYFGTLIPCLREMTKDFVKFLSLVLILYLGFLTTFTLLARDNFTARQMTVILIKVFFGSSYLGFEVAQDM
ncbi:hypothetical protein BT63DRAFT_422387 [Microthyrium microscopicum]|uniref:Calcium channel YVC1-like C-terminal transmembrane domain-containing protein n=1 Tax=Microthyrium microscopicum TaxID=703497 RepID=A0A6A6UJJ2_9PEZI|nr:hypothetical protein BT63DRAFT_422387 [Microthyrium microscopicum]